MSPTRKKNTTYTHPESGDVLKDFSAWSPWGNKQPHSKDNDLFIPVTYGEGFTKRPEFPLELLERMKRNWRTAVRPNFQSLSAMVAPPGATAQQQKRAGLTIGRAAPPAPGVAAAPGAVAPGRPGVMNPQGAVRPSLRQRFPGRLNGNWDHFKSFEMVGAYTFRGDQRDPHEIKRADGFQPSAMRTDQLYVTTVAKYFVTYLEMTEGPLDVHRKAQAISEVEQFVRGQMSTNNLKLLGEYMYWQEVYDSQKLHLIGMTHDSFYRAYVSTTRDISIACAGTTGLLASGSGVKPKMGFGWVYVLRVESGFLLKMGVGGYTKHEAEIAHLGPIEWECVYGFMCMGDKDTIFIRKGFENTDYEAFLTVLSTLSNTN